VRTALLRRPLHASARRSGKVRSPRPPGGGGERAWGLSVSPSSGLWSLPSGGRGLDWRRNMWDTLTSVSLITGGLPAATPAAPAVRSQLSLARNRRSCAPRLYLKSNRARTAR
jgi:hypothetical protein